jgi:ABC-type sugar transport system permease subunit
VDLEHLQIPAAVSGALDHRIAGVFGVPDFQISLPIVHQFQSVRRSELPRARKLQNTVHRSALSEIIQCNGDLCVARCAASAGICAAAGAGAQPEGAGAQVFRAIYYLPALLGGSVAIAVLWRQVFGIEGIFNQFLGMLGAPESLTSISWITNPKYSLYTLILLRVWQFGSPMIIFLAGLKQIPPELYESASIDGANALRKFTRITLPMLSPIIVFNLIMQIISAFQAFTPAYIVGGVNGGALDSMLFYTLYLYNLGFVYYKMGLASAMAWILMIVIAVFTVIVLRSTSKITYYSD